MKTHDYLWDPKGPPDAGVAEIERALRPSRYVPRAFEWPEEERRQNTGRAQRWRLVIDRRRPLLAAAAALLLATVSIWLASPGASRSAAGWPVEVVSGKPVVGTRPISASGSLALGHWIQTDGRSKAVVQVVGLGRVTVHPNTRLRLKEDTESRKLLELPRGTIHAFITAPPELFLVDTPAAMAVDLGCEYTLAVDDSGAGLLEVSLGYVRLEGHGRRSTVPMGAACVTRPGAGPGTPYSQEASAELKAALERFDLRGEGGALESVLAEARPRDAFSLWHLLQRTAGADRERVYEKLAELKPPPASLTREGILALDEWMLEEWWDWMLF